MKKLLSIMLLMLLSNCKNNQLENINYPELVPVNVSETLHGKTISDPYRNLENLKDSNNIKWFKKNEELVNSVMGKIPNRDFFYRKLKGIDNQTKKSLNTYRLTSDKSYFYLKSTNEDPTEKLFYRESKSSPEALLLDPTTYQKDWSINHIKPSWDGKRVAIGISPNGEDKTEIIIYDVKNKKLLPDVVPGAALTVAGSIEWLPDSSGFIYLRFPHFRYEDPSYLSNSESVLYKIGQGTKGNNVIFSKSHNSQIPFKSGDNPRISIPTRKSEYIIGKIGNVSKYKRTYFSPSSDLNQEQMDWKLLYTENEQIAHSVIKDDTLYYSTSKENSNFDICMVPLDKLDFTSPEILVRPDENEIIVDFEISGNSIFFLTLKNGTEGKLYQKELEGSLQEIRLPVPSGDTSLDLLGDNLVIGTDGWTAPYALFEYDVKNSTFETLMLQENKYKNEFSGLKVEELEVASHDGTEVPLSLIYRNGMKKDGNNRTLILTYGSYGVSTSPTFVSFLLIWLAKGDIVAIPHVRGGGEKGDDWHKAGFKSTKSNTWKDFIACTEYLIKEGYTSNEYTVAFGNSAGGIPAGRAITETPDLYASAIMTAPALNMLRCEFQPNGQTNIPEFGTVKNSTEFRGLLAMDSYQHLDENTKYPSVMINVGMNDGVVTPWDPGKFIAKLQNMTATTEPTLLSVDFNANHSGGGTLDSEYKKYSELYSFALWQTGHPDFQPE